MSWQLRFKKSAFAELQRLPLDVQKRIDDALQILIFNPYNRALNIKKLKGYDNLFRLRTGDYRVLYEISKDILTVIVIRVGHRKDVYCNPWKAKNSCLFPIRL
jgi:mRNA interferase RelE/StbE